MAKKSCHHGDLKRGLIEAALEILDEDTKLSLRTVAQRVGVSPNAAYRHFDDLEDMLGEVAVVAFGELSASLEGAISADLSLEQAQRRAMRAYVDYALAFPGRYALLFSQQIPIFEHDAARAAAESTFSIVGALAARAGAPEPDQTAFLVLTMLHGTIELLKREALPGTLEASRDRLIELTMDEAVHVVARALGDEA